MTSLIPIQAGGDARPRARCWALGAAVLPLLVRGRSAALDLVATAGWAAALAAGTGALGEALMLDPPRGLVAGALAAAPSRSARAPSEAAHELGECVPPRSRRICPGAPATVARAPLSVA